MKRKKKENELSVFSFAASIFLFQIYYETFYSSSHLCMPQMSLLYFLLQHLYFYSRFTMRLSIVLVIYIHPVSKLVPPEFTDYYENESPFINTICNLLA